MSRGRARAAWLNLAFAGLLAVASPAVAQSGMDKDSDGRFTGIAIITDNLKWYRLFESPKTPQIDGKDVFRAGERGALALILSNAVPKGGVVKVECDITAFDPSGSKVIVDDGVCYEGPFYGENILMPALLDLQFEINEGDKAGAAGFRIVLRDVQSGRKVKLTVGYRQDTGR